MQENKQSSYSLKELCQLAGVTERTVRYYIQEGLLPPPQGMGPFSRYSGQHLRQLLVIRRLKSEYLPLNEIRSQLSGLSQEELEKLALQAQQIPSEEKATAREYLDTLLDKESQTPLLRYQLTQATQPLQQGQAARKAPAQSAQQAPEPGAPTLASQPVVSEPAKAYRKTSPVSANQVNEPAALTPPALSAPASGLDSEGISWQRIDLGQGVELHLRQGGSEDSDQRQRLVQQIIHYARQLLGKERETQ